MADTIYPLQAPPTHNHPGNQRDTQNNVLPTTNRTPFPQQLNKLQHCKLGQTRSENSLYVTSVPNLRPTTPCPTKTQPLWTRAPNNKPQRI